MSLKYFAFLLSTSILKNLFRLAFSEFCLVKWRVSQIDQLTGHSDRMSIISEQKANIERWFAYSIM